MPDVASTTFYEDHASRFKPILGTRSQRSEIGQYSDDVVYITAATSQLRGQIAGGTPSLYDAALARLRSFRCWGDNWDGEGSSSPDHASINAAINLLALLQATHLPFGVHLDSDSRPMFFLRTSDWTGEISIEDALHISFEFRSPDDILDGYDLEFDGEEFPNPLCNAIDRVSKPLIDL